MNLIDDCSTTNQRIKLDRERTTMVDEEGRITNKEKGGDHPTTVEAVEGLLEVEEAQVVDDLWITLED
jgi:hypothetical protein